MMAEVVGSAAVGEVVSTAASFVTSKWKELSGVSDKIEQLEWKVLKIQSAIEESKQYDIDNEPLREMQKKLINAAQEGDNVLRAFKIQSTARPDPQTSAEGVIRLLNSDVIPMQNASANERPPFCWAMDALRPLCTIMESLHHNRKRLVTHMNNVLSFPATSSKRETLNRILERIEVLCDGIGVFLQLVRQQRRKRGRRGRCRPHSGFFMFVYLELAQDALSNCWADHPWMQFLVAMMTVVTLLETNGEFRLRVGDAGIIEVPKVVLDFFKFSHKSLPLV